MNQINYGRLWNIYHDYVLNYHVNGKISSVPTEISSELLDVIHDILSVRFMVEKKSEQLLCEQEGIKND